MVSQQTNTEGEITKKFLVQKTIVNFWDAELKNIEKCHEDVEVNRYSVTKGKTTATNIIMSAITIKKGAFKTLKKEDKGEKIRRKKV